MSTQTWTVAEAKAKFSEVVEKVRAVASAPIPPPTPPDGSTAVRGNGLGGVTRAFRTTSLNFAFASATVHVSLAHGRCSGSETIIVIIVILPWPGKISCLDLSVGLARVKPPGPASGRPDDKSAKTRGRRCCYC